MKVTRKHSYIIEEINYDNFIKNKIYSTPESDYSYELNDEFFPEGVYIHIEEMDRLRYYETIAELKEHDGVNYATFNIYPNDGYAEIEFNSGISTGNGEFLKELNEIEMNQLVDKYLAIFAKYLSE